MRIQKDFLALTILGVTVAYSTCSAASPACTKLADHENVAEYLVAPTKRSVGRFEQWFQTEVMKTMGRIEESSHKEISAVLGKSRGEFAKAQNAPDHEAFGRLKEYGEFLETPFVPNDTKPSYVEMHNKIRTNKEMLNITCSQTCEVDSGRGIKGFKREDVSTTYKKNRTFTQWYNTYEKEPLSVFTYDEYTGAYREKFTDALHANYGHPKRDIINFDRTQSTTDKLEKVKKWVDWMNASMDAHWTRAVNAKDPTTFFNELSQFTYLHANYMPYERGSATILEIKIWSLMMKRGFKVELFDKAIDLKAIVALSEKDFRIQDHLGLGIQ